MSYYFVRDVKRLASGFVSGSKGRHSQTFLYYQTSTASFYAIVVKSEIQRELTYVGVVRVRSFEKRDMW